MNESSGTSSIDPAGAPAGPEPAGSGGSLEDYPQYLDSVKEKIRSQHVQRCTTKTNYAVYSKNFTAGMHLSTSTSSSLRKKLRYIKNY